MSEKVSLQSIQDRLDKILIYLMQIATNTAPVYHATVKPDLCTCGNPAYTDMTARPPCPVHDTIMVTGAGGGQR